MLIINCEHFHVAAFYAIVSIYVVLLLLYVPGLPLNGKFVVSVLGFMFSAFFYLLAYWRENAVIDKNSGNVTSERGLPPFCKARKARLKDFSRVSIAWADTNVDSGRSLAVTLQKDTGEDFVLICSWSASKAWHYAVMVAKDLNFSLNDRLFSDGKIWSIHDLLLVPTWKDRKKMRKLAGH